MLRPCPTGPSPARPNNVIAPFWTDLDGTGRAGHPASPRSTDGVDTWIVVEWQVNVFGHDQPRTSRSGSDLATTPTPSQDISFAYAPAASRPTRRSTSSSAPRTQRARATWWPCCPPRPRVMSTDPVPGDTVSYTLDVTRQPAGRRSGDHRDDGRPGVPGTTIVRSDITIVP